jgi:hypothetical protein
MVKRAAVREVSLYPGSTLGEPSLLSTAYRQMILSATLEGGSCADAVREQGDLSRARMLLEESLALSRGKEHAWGIARTLASLASVAGEAGEYARASMLYEESLELARRMGMNHTILPCLEGLSRVALAQGRMEHGQHGSVEHLPPCTRIWAGPFRRLSAAGTTVPWLQLAGHLGKRRLRRRGQGATR